MSSALAERPGADVLPEISGAASLLNGRYAPPPADGDGKSWVRTSALIQRDAQVLYALWRDVESAPKWHERMESVTPTGEKTSHWVLRDGDKTLEWDFEILADEPGKRIAWRSLPGEPKNAGPESAGEVLFEPAPGGRGTLVTVLECFRIGALANAWESATGRGAHQATIENLRHFKALAETGEVPRTEPQPHGKRGLIAEQKRSLYGETIPTPPNTAETKQGN